MYHQSPQTSADSSGRFRRLGAVVGAGLVAGLIAVGAGGVASAQVDGSAVVTPDTIAAFQLTDESPEPPVDDLDVETPDADDAEFVDFEVSPEDEAVFERFDQCLVDNGIVFEAFDGEDVEDGDEAIESFLAEDEAQLDAAFETCEPILDELSADLQQSIEFEDFDLSLEDEAVFERFDQCLVDNGIVFEAFDGEDGDEAIESFLIEDEAQLDAAFEACEPILDELSADVLVELEDCEEHDEAGEGDDA